MAKYEEQNQLDYRFGGDTLDDFAFKYSKEITRVFRFLNDLKCNTINSVEYTAPAAGQIKIEDNKLYIRNKENTEWVYMGEIKPNFGFKSAEADFISTEDISKKKIGEINDLEIGDVLTKNNIGSTAGKIPTLNENELLDVSISGNAGKIAGHMIKTFAVNDGQVITFSSALNAWTNEDLSVVVSKLEYDEEGDIMPAL